MRGGPGYPELSTGKQTRCIRLLNAPGEFFHDFIPSIILHSDSSAERTFELSEFLTAS
ncbi:hypothetical protein IWQ48_006138, partial [Labrenzia sp. EL_13]|nr:hypothetical protein [Labrenzia sp. EL_162]MBG6166086.1 hypothetical protein [Labrenzia sp. EL_195]MBG6198583.1 hypothetical protein [Labrenzia sp. EL_159]MBG6204968.1 hypothetical protein [Labrenzia sp. EL_13]